MLNTQAWMLQDGLGSVRGAADPTGATVWSTNYVPFGEMFGAAGIMPTSYGFTGERYSAGGLYLRARHYAPGYGVFTSLDPFEGLHQRPMSLNGYSWVEGNVANSVDPTGRQAEATFCFLCPECCVAALVLGGIGSLLLLGLLQKVKVDVNINTSSDEFPCSDGGPNALGQYMPFGFEAPNSRHVGLGYIQGDPLSDLRCHLRYFNGSDYDALFEQLTTQHGVGFRMSPSFMSPGLPAFVGGYNSPGTIFIPQPPEGLVGTRADRLAQFIEEITHAAQYHNLPSFGGCTMGALSSEVEPKARFMAWIYRSRIPLSAFRDTGAWIGLSLVGGAIDNDALRDAVARSYRITDSSPAFPFIQADGALDWTMSSCPDGMGGRRGVPFLPSSPVLARILRDNSSCLDLPSAILI